MTTGGFIEQCEKEALQLSGAIQPHGALLIVDGEGDITHASMNIDRFLGTASGLIGERLPDNLARVLSGLDSTPASYATRMNVDFGGQSASVVATRSGNGSAAIEILPTQPDADGGSILPVLSFSEFSDQGSMIRARQELVTHIQGQTGFDRVLYYEFHEDQTGEVVAEATGAGVDGSYLGLRFPASDIPKVARDLYLKTPWRTIPDSTASPVDIVGSDGAPPDLSFVDLRSVSPIHLSYMQNMGVAGAISIPVKTASRLQALISCHSFSPRSLPLPHLQTITQQVSSYNLRLRELASSRRMNLLAQLEARLHSWRARLDAQGFSAEAWPDFIQFLMEEFEADGVWLDTGTQVYQVGVVPDREAMGTIQDWLRDAEVSGGVSISQSIARDCPEDMLTEVAGLAGFSLGMSHAAPLACYCFRREEVQEVAWGGNPNKPVEQSVGNYEITPRRSFERWVETRLGYCREWPDQTRLKLLTLRGFLTELVS